MRYLHILDKEAPKWFEEVCQDMTTFHESAGLNIEHIYDYRELKDLPKEVYWGDYEGISKYYLQSITSGVKSEYGNKIDRVNIAITDQNWNLNGVWGWNMGIPYNGYDLHQTRIETRKSRPLETQKANTFGTLYHESSHANGHMAQRGLLNKISVEGLINNNLKLSIPLDNYQEGVVHGNHPDFDYIRFDNNREVIDALSVALSYQANKKRIYSGDMSSIGRYLNELMEELVLIQEKLRIRKEEGIKPLSLEEQEILTKEYKKVIKSK